ncbi:MAG TPA: hypothetical protein VF121_03000 [Thermoanaerobaculia bacterium]|nr:hypothetical protein [Thermoanaerobaculia bacterium]
MQFVLVNLGNVRAENVTLKFEGGFDRNKPREPLAKLEFFGIPIPQLAPGQALFLFRIDDHDLNRWPEGGGHSLGLKDETFFIKASYFGPARGFNRLARVWSWLRRRPQYAMQYTFDPKIVRTDFPSPEYHG